MQQKTLLAKHIDIVNMKHNLDNSCKKLLSHKIILAWIMKYTMKEYRRYRIHYIMQHFILDENLLIVPTSLHRDDSDNLIQGANTEDSSLTEGTVYYDILYRVLLPHTKQTIAMFINVEAQSNYHPGYPLTKRGIYYCCRMISAQYGTIFTNSHYEKIQKVYSVWVCTNPPKYLQNTLSAYRIRKDDYIGTVTEPTQNYDLLSLIMIRLGSVTQPQKGSNRLLNMLSTLLSPDIPAEEKKHRLETQFKIPMTKEMKEDIDTMCNYSDGVIEIMMERGLKQGLEKGMAKGMEEGMEKGMEKGTFTILSNLIKNGLISLEDAAKQVNLSVMAFQKKLQEFQ